MNLIRRQWCHQPLQHGPGDTLPAVLLGNNHQPQRGTLFTPQPAQRTAHHLPFGLGYHTGTQRPRLLPILQPVGPLYLLRQFERGRKIRVDHWAQNNARFFLGHLYLLIHLAAKIALSQSSKFGCVWHIAYGLNMD
ncbi:hypothetical protein D3C78_942110 [compost metagenome]